MHKKIKVLLALIVFISLAGSFLLGWRVMPKIWPDIKTNIVYKLIPSLEPEKEEKAPYIPQSNAEFGDAISKTNSLIYYFYKPYCPYCEAIDALISGLPEKIYLPDGTESNIKLVAVNKEDKEGLKIIEQYYADNNIPEEKRFVPAIVIGDKHLMPGKEIIEQLSDALVSGKGLETPLLNGSERQ